MQELNNEIINHIEKEILPIYHNFDKGHNEKHIKEVVERSLKYYKILNREDLDINMVYVVASYHDIGVKIKREGHPKFSGQILREDKNLRRWFNDNEIEIMAEACEDHSTSTGHSPRSIYGEIVSDADKDTDIDSGVMRGWNFSLHYYPEMTFEEHLTDLHDEIVRRFGDESIGGQNLVKFYIPCSENSEFVDMMKLFAKDKSKLREKIISLIK